MQVGDMAILSFTDVLKAIVIVACDDVFDKGV